MWIRLASYDSSDRATLPDPRLSSAPADEKTIADALISSRSDVDVRSVRDPDATTSAATALSARQQRYNELLREAPPNPIPTVSRVAPPREVKPPTILDRVVSALGGKPKQEMPPPAPPSQPPPQRAAKDTPAPKSNAETADASDDDPEADIAAPQLISAEFIPAQVQDGEATTLAVVARDNLSGVRNVSGVVTSPSGSMHGFACKREGESSRFVTKISVPREAASGTWHVKYLTLSDNASNSVNLNYVQGALPRTASFVVVSSMSDSTAPVLKAVRLERPAMRAGERNRLFVQAEDDRTGVKTISGVFISPSKTARLGFGCSEAQPGAWECAVTPPKCLDCGVWKLEQLQLQDNASNMSTMRGDHSLVNPIAVDISGDACDSAPPALSSLTLTPSMVSNTEDSTIEVRALISDDGCGVASLSGQAIPPGGVGGQRAHFSLQPAGDGHTFVGRMTIKQHAATGVWTISWLQALDKGHNLRAYAANDPVVSKVTFQVE